MERKYPNVSILNIHATMDNEQWNAYLTRCLQERNVSTLMKVYYGLQADMSDLAKANINSESVSTLFIRLTRSIEKTVKRIYREKYPSPLDNPLQARNWTEDLAKHKIMKKNRDLEFEKFLRDASF